MTTNTINANQPMYVHTTNYLLSAPEDKEAFLTPRLPDLPGNWELITVVITGVICVFYWKNIPEVQVVFRQGEVEMVSPSPHVEWATEEITTAAPDEGQQGDPHES